MGIYEVEIPANENSVNRKSKMATTGKNILSEKILGIIYFLEILVEIFLAEKEFFHTMFFL
jgi:hypothetical protein